MLTASHVLDHFVFTSRRLSEKTKWIVFGTVAFLIFATFWWFRGVAFGIDGPINEHWGLKWRSVRLLSYQLACLLTKTQSWNIYDD